MDQNTDSWMDPIVDAMGRLSIVRTNAFELGREIRIRIDSDETEPDHRVYVNREPEPATGSITFFHPWPAIPSSLTPTGTLIVYTIREQLSRSPPPIPDYDLDMDDDVGYRCYFVLLQQRFYEAMQNLKRADAELERGFRESPADGRLIIVSETERSSIALSIVRGLRLLQTRTARPCQICLLCNRLPAPPREPEALPEGSSDRRTNTLRVRCRTVFGSGRFTEINLVDSVYILPPIREEEDDDDEDDDEDEDGILYMLCKFHRYVFLYLMYQVVSPSWPVPHLQEDMATFGEIAVARWNPVAQMWQIDEPTD